ncbi:hypothetical protein BSKO_13815 [Bryopsis sp. KO-2023]|nr:hypothetical protein BSKO_13815 [Bryopsis sp. KO-2023]
MEDTTAFEGDGHQEKDAEETQEQAPVEQPPPSKNGTESPSQVTPDPSTGEVDVEKLDPEEETESGSNQDLEGKHAAVEQKGENLEGEETVGDHGSIKQDEMEQEEYAGADDRIKGEDQLGEEVEEDDQGVDGDVGAQENSPEQQQPDEEDCQNVDGDGGAQEISPDQQEPEEEEDQGVDGDGGAQELAPEQQEPDEEDGQCADGDGGAQENSPEQQEPDEKEVELNHEQNLVPASVDEVKMDDSETEQNSEDVGNGDGVNIESGELAPVQNEDETLVGKDAQEVSDPNDMGGGKEEQASEQDQNEPTVAEVQAHDSEKIDPHHQGGDNGDGVEDDNEELAFKEILDDQLVNDQTSTIDLQEGVGGDQGVNNNGGAVVERLGEPEGETEALEIPSVDDGELEETQEGYDEDMAGGPALDMAQEGEDGGSQAKEEPVVDPPEGDRELEVVVPEQDLGAEITVENQGAVLRSDDASETLGDTKDFEEGDHENGASDMGPNSSNEQIPNQGEEINTSRPEEEEGGNANLIESMKPLSKKEPTADEQTEEKSQDHGNRAGVHGEWNDYRQPQGVVKTESLENINGGDYAVGSINTDIPELVQNPNRQGATGVTPAVPPPVEDLNHMAKTLTGLGVNADGVKDVDYGMGSLGVISSSLKQGESGGIVGEDSTNQATTGGNLLNASHLSFSPTRQGSNVAGTQNFPGEQPEEYPGKHSSSSIRDEWKSTHQTAPPHKSSPHLQDADRGAPGLTSQLLGGGVHSENDPLRSHPSHIQHLEQDMGRTPSRVAQPTVQDGVHESRFPFPGEPSNGALNQMQSRQIGNGEYQGEHGLTSQRIPNTSLLRDVGVMPPVGAHTPPQSTPVQFPTVQQFNPALYPSGGNSSRIPDHKLQQDQPNGSLAGSHLMRPQGQQFMAPHYAPSNANHPEHPAAEEPTSAQDTVKWPAGVVSQQERAQPFYKDDHQQRPLLLQENESVPHSQTTNVDIAPRYAIARQRRTWETAQDGTRPIPFLSTPAALPEIGTHGYSPMVPGSPVSLCQDDFRLWNDSGPRAPSPNYVPDGGDHRFQDFHRVPNRQVDLGSPNHAQAQSTAFRESYIGHDDRNTNVSPSGYNVAAIASDGQQREPVNPSPSLRYGPPEPVDVPSPSSHRRQVYALPESVPPMALPLPPSTGRKTPTNIVTDRVTYRPPTRSYITTRPKTAQSIIVAAGSGTKAARERLKSAIMREAEVRMEAEMNAIDVEDLKLQKEIAEVTATEDAAVREDLEEQLQKRGAGPISCVLNEGNIFEPWTNIRHRFTCYLQKAHTEIERLQEDNAWRELDEERRQRHHLQDHVGVLRREIETLKKCLQQETDNRISAEKTLQDERKQWMAYIGNLSKTHQRSVAPEPPKPRAHFYSDDIRSDLRELQATVREANKNTQDILQSSRRTGRPPSSCAGVDQYLEEGTQGWNLPHHGSGHRPARAPPSESNLGLRGTWGMSGMRTPNTLPHVSPQATQMGVPRPWSPSARLHGVISDMHPPQYQSGPQEWGTRQGLQQENAQLRNTNTFESDVPYELPGSTRIWGGAHDMAGKSENRAAPEPQGFAPPKRGRKTFEFVEPVPPTKVNPSDLMQARMDYMQVLL